jgi:hypothetical protein
MHDFGKACNFELDAFHNCWSLDFHTKITGFCASNLLDAMDALKSLNILLVQVYFKCKLKFWHNFFGTLDRRSYDAILSLFGALDKASGRKVGRMKFLFNTYHVSIVFQEFCLIIIAFWFSAKKLIFNWTRSFYNRLLQASQMTTF